MGVIKNWADFQNLHIATNGDSTTSSLPSSPPSNKKIFPDIPQCVSSSDPKVAAQQACDMRNIVRRKLTGYVGFANLPNQWHRKSVRKGFNFNIMVVGKLKNNQINLILSNVV